MAFAAQKLFGKCSEKKVGVGKSWQSWGGIQASENKFQIICAGKKEEANSLVEENRKRKNGNYVMCQSMDILYSRGNLVAKNVNDLAIRLSSVRGENVNDKADVGNMSARILGAVKSLVRKKREGGQRDKI